MGGAAFHMGHRGRAPGKMRGGGGKQAKPNAGGVKAKRDQSGKREPTDFGDVEPGERRT